MTGTKRKRPSKGVSSEGAVKCQKVEEALVIPNHGLLSLYYPNVSSLRTYILSRFPKSSRSRKQRLRSVTFWNKARETNGNPCQAELGTAIFPTSSSLLENERLAQLLDETIIGYGLEVQKCLPALQARGDLRALTDEFISSTKSSEGSNNVDEPEVSQGTQWCSVLC